MSGDQNDLDMEDSDFGCTCKTCCYSCSCVCAKRKKDKKKKPKETNNSKFSFFNRRSRMTKHQKESAKTTSSQKESVKMAPSQKDSPKMIAMKRAQISYDKLGQDNESYLLKEGEVCEVYDSDAEDEKLAKGEPCQSSSEENVSRTKSEQELSKCEASNQGKDSKPDEGIVYKMNHKCRGKALILLQSEGYACFDPKIKGICTNHLVEADVLKTLFTTLGFEVEVNDCGACKAGDIQKLLGKVAKDDHSDADCFICIILGHGGNHELFCRNKTLEVEEITKSFKGDTCQTLAGKPKLFFIQFCQGQEIALSQAVTDSVVCDTPTHHSAHIPSEADFMISLATIPGEISTGDAKSISPYVQALSETLLNNYADMDLLRMMTYVNYAIKDMNDCLDDGADVDLEIPMIMSMLTKDLYFPPQLQRISPPASESIMVECDMETSSTML